MAVTFPTTLDTLNNPNPTDSTATVSHSAQHSDANDAIEALEAKVGVDGSVVESSLDYKVKHGVVDEINITEGITNANAINFGTDTALFREGARELRLDGQLAVNDRIVLVGDTGPLRFYHANGEIEFGDSAGNYDTNLYRSAASVLKTDDALNVGGELVTRPFSAVVGTSGTQADFICDGVDDDVQIQAAIDSLPYSETLGIDLVTNGSFTGSATGWTLGTGWTYNSNSVICDGMDEEVGISQQIEAGVVDRQLYKVTLTVGGSSGYVDVFIGDNWESVSLPAGTGATTIYLATSAFSDTNTILYIVDVEFNGTIDDVVAQKVTSRESGGTVFIKRGAYVLGNGLSLSKPGINILGEGIGVTTLQLKPAFPNYTSAISGGYVVENATISNLTIDGNKENQTTDYHSGITSSSSCVVDGVEIKNLNQDGDTAGVYCVSNQVVSNCVFRGNIGTACFSNGDNVIIKNNTFSDNGRACYFSGNGSIFTSNVISDSVSGSFGDFSLSLGGNGLLVSGNTISTPRGGITLGGSYSSVFSNNVIRGVGLVADNTYDAIFITNSATNNIFTGNQILDDLGGNKFANGIREETEYDTNNIITNNMISSWVTLAISTISPSSDVSHNITS